MFDNINETRRALKNDLILLYIPICTDNEK